ncbi:MAG TPA: hypothetical protein VGP16_24290 [Asanoa sp.]|nr:hypothetical protein [Asanoa sp.]
MYFGDLAAPDWPLVIVAWTAVELLDYGAASASHVDVTLHRGGSFSAAVAQARVARPTTARAMAVDDLMRGRMWWHDLCQSTTVDVRRDGLVAGEPDVVGDEVVWDGLSIVVRMTLDPAVIDAPSAWWWSDGQARLRTLFSTGDFRLKPGYRVNITDDAAGA